MGLGAEAGAAGDWQAGPGARLFATAVREPSASNANKPMRFAVKNAWEPQYAVANCIIGAGLSWSVRSFMGSLLVI